MIFLSAGHHNADPGAVANGYKEAELAKELRDLIAREIKRIGGSYILDKDSETLAQYIARIKPGPGSVLCELHFNSVDNPKVTGTECLHADSANADSIRLAKEIAETCSKSLGITNRGAKSESQSKRGRLAILRTAAGISVLPEICFISNAEDLRKYQERKTQLAACIAHILVAYDKLK